MKTEKGVQIKVQQEASPVVETTEAEEGGHIESNNPYLYDCSGPKKVIDYSKPDVEQDDQDGFEFLDGNAQGLKTAIEQDGSYSVNYGNKEKFSI